MPTDESIFEDIEALDEDFEAVDEALDEAFDEEFGEAYNNNRRGGRGGGGRSFGRGSSGSATRSGYNNTVRGSQPNLFGSVKTPAGTAKVQLPNSVASKKDLKSLTDGIVKDMKQNQSAIQSISKNLNNADKNISKSNSNLEKKVMALQLASLAALVIQPTLRTINVTDSAGNNSTLKVNQAKYDYLLPIIAAVAIPLLVNSGKGTGPGANVLPLILILGLVILANYTTAFGSNTPGSNNAGLSVPGAAPAPAQGQGGGQGAAVAQGAAGAQGAAAQGAAGPAAAQQTQPPQNSGSNFLSNNGPILIVALIALLTLTDSKIFG